MNCATCKVNKIGPKTTPFGGYLCGNEHMQCVDCNDRTDGQCGICEEHTFFVQMNFNHRNRNTSPMTRNFPISGQVPTAPSIDVKSHPVTAATLESASSCIFPKAFFNDMETQSSISQEQLSMHESHDSMSEDQSETDDVQILPSQYRAPTPSAASLSPSYTPMSLSMSIPMSMNQYLPNAQERIQMDTLFFGSNHQPQSASNFTFQFLTENGFMRLMQARDSSTPTLEVIEAPKSIQLTTEHTNLCLCGTSCDGACGPGVERTKESVGADETEDVIHTSEIRFMESTESMKNYFSGGTIHPIIKTKHEPLSTTTTTHSRNYESQESLSTKKLHDFESRNTAQPAELVESYLRTYGPLALCQFPAYSFSHSCQDSACEPADGLHNRRQSIQTATASVSTESEPTLASTKKTEFPAKYLPPDYFVMQAVGVAAPTPDTIPNPDKIARPSIDLRMQKVLETFQENPRTLTVSEKPIIDQSKKYFKIMDQLELPALVEPTMPLINGKHLDQTCSCELPAEKPSIDIMAQLSNTHRAFYNPPIGQPLSGVTHQSNNFPCSEPPPQFQLVTCSNIMESELLHTKGRLINLKPTPACHLTIPRSPIKCPESSCQRMIFVSDFNKHLIVDHSMLPMERIAPRQCKNFFLDPKLAHCGNSKCHLLYLIRDKITDLGSSKFKDFLPLLVMSTRIRLSDLCGIDAHEYPNFWESEANTEYLMIWLTGIVPEEFHVAVSLTVWSRSGHVPVCHMVHSGEMYSVRRSQEVKDVCHSGQMLLLSASEMQLLTNWGKEMLELQIVVH
ncbi:uncharacterized protein LOC118746466 [Rhagoletis pomonella]|uniref:uncharacterized protein LOC118746466 n=1 Tax=Rhagoletis pomonella TaxID=28610 RepID=UPI00178272D4|nr:uncharacterized protein LOC118746466 [Rhagoletis pomonella]